MVTIVVLLGLSRGGEATEQVNERDVTQLVTKATTSRAARADAIRSLPLDKLTPGQKAAVAAVTSKATIYRRMPVQVNDCDPEMYDFLIRNPEVIVGIWEKMGISNVSLRRIGKQTFRASDGHGTLCHVELLHSDYQTHLIYAEGSYDGPLVTKPIRAKCVLLLKSGYVNETNGRYYITSQMDTFIKIESLGVQLMAKMFQPLVGKAADVNFIETAAFVGRLSRTAEANPEGVKRLGGRLEAVSAETQKQFNTVTDRVAEKARKRHAALRAARPHRVVARRPAEPKGR